MNQSHIDKDRRISLEIGETLSSYYFKKNDDEVEFNDNYTLDDKIMLDIISL